MSQTLIKFLMVIYFFILCACLCERNYPKALYWGSAMGLLASVLWGFK